MLWSYTKRFLKTAIAIVALFLVCAMIIYQLLAPKRTSDADLAAAFIRHRHEYVGIEVCAAMASATYLNPSDPIPPELKLLERNGWYRDFLQRDDEGSGLTYSVYVRMNENGIWQVVIAFRGTNPRDSRDWKSNLRILNTNRDYNDQYSFGAMQIIDELEWCYDQYGPDVLYYATGHSLGGGLAQMAAYRHRWITKAIVFNSSPVTGWNDAWYEDEDERHNEPFTVVAVHERGEVLDYIRVLQRSARGRPKNLKEYDELILDEQNWGLISQHGIDSLAKHLIAEARRLGVEAKAVHDDEKQ